MVICSYGRRGYRLTTIRTIDSTNMFRKIFERRPQKEYEFSINVIQMRKYRTKIKKFGKTIFPYLLVTGWSILDIKTVDKLRTLRKLSRGTCLVT